MSNNTEFTRQAFEEWAAKKLSGMDIENKFNISAMLRRNSSGDYVDRWTFHVWQGWIGAVSTLLGAKSEVAHSPAADTDGAETGIEPPVLTTIELGALSQRCLAAEEGDREAQKELEYFSPSVLAGIINELIESRELLRKASLSKPNNSQPDPIRPIGGGRYVDLSRVQDIEPKQEQVCLTLVSGAVAWAPIEMAEELIQAWQAIRRAQVWGKKP